MIINIWYILHDPTVHPNPMESIPETGYPDENVHAKGPVSRRLRILSSYPPRYQHELFFPLRRE